MNEVSLAGAAERIANASKIVLTTHIRPDGDALGSLLGLYHYLLAAGKKVSMLLDDDVPPMYRFLPGFEHISRPDAGRRADLLIILDASDEDRIGGVKDMVKGPTLNIDHHVSNTGFADFSWVDSQAAATGEMILQLLLKNQADISPDIAACLYTAIATDSGFFRYANTTADTFRHAARLVEHGARPQEVSEHLEAKPLASVLALGKVLATLEMHAANRVACLTLTKDIMEEIKEYSEGLVNYPRNIEGVEVAIMFKEADDDNVRVSFRSRGVDVCKLAMSFGGGGHVRAAGCTVKGRIQGVKEQVLSLTLQQFQAIV